MQKKTVSEIALMFLLMGTSALSFNLKVAEASLNPTVYVNPPSVADPTLTSGSRFTVNVTVLDVDSEIGCFAWQVNMSWDADVLEFVNVTEGDFLKDQPEGTDFLSRVENREGWALFGCSTIGPYLGVKGSGTLATVEFLVVGTGESIISTDHPLTYLLGLQESPPPPPPVFIKIPSIKESGYFSNVNPMEAMQSLIETIEIWNLHRGTQDSLIARLKVAKHLIDLGKEGGTLLILTAFIVRVEGLRERILTDEQADYLISEARKISDLIEGQIPQHHLTFFHLKLH